MQKHSTTPFLEFLDLQNDNNRVYRGHIGRIRASDALFMMSRVATFTAALEIQRIGRGYIHRHV